MAMAGVCAVPPKTNPGPLPMCGDVEDHASSLCNEPPKPLCAETLTAKYHRSIVKLYIKPNFDVICPEAEEGEPPGISVFAVAPAIEQTGFFIDHSHIEPDHCEEEAYIVSTGSFFSEFYNALKAETAPGFPTIVNGLMTMLQTTFDIEKNEANPSLKIVDYFNYYAEIYDVNGCQRSYMYAIFLIGYDPNTGVALFRVPRNHPINCGLPSFKNNPPPGLKWGSSKMTPKGQGVAMLHGGTFQPSVSISTGVVVNNNVVPENNFPSYTGIMTTIPGTTGVAGAPLLNPCGDVIGIATALFGSTSFGSRGGQSYSTFAYDHHAAQVYGVAQVSAEKVVDAFIWYDKTRHQQHCRRPENVHVDCRFGFMLYNQAQFPWTFSATNTPYLLETTPYTYSQVPEMNPADFGEINREIRGVVVTSEGDPFFGFVNDELVFVPYEEPIFENGFRLTANAVDIDDDCCNDEDIQNIEPGDIIISINGIPIGQLPCQENLFDLMRRHCGRDAFTLCFIKAGLGTFSEDDPRATYRRIYSRKYCFPDSLYWLHGPCQYPETRFERPAFTAFVFNLVSSTERHIFFENISNTEFVSLAFPTKALEAQRIMGMMSQSGAWSLAPAHLLHFLTNPLISALPALEDLTMDIIGTSAFYYVECPALDDDGGNGGGNGGGDGDVGP